MLKIHHFFFINFLGLFLATLIVSSLLSYSTLKSYILKSKQEELHQMLQLITLNMEAIDNLDNYSKSIYEKNLTRFTVIGKNGDVIAESNFDKKSMDNHALRKEVKNATLKETAYSIRYSQTLDVDFVYVAKKIYYHDNIITLRLSSPLKEVTNEFYSLWITIIILFNLLIFIALIISYFLSRKIGYDVKHITTYLDEIANNNYNAVIKTEHFREFLHISLLLKNMIKKLHQRDKQKRKYTAKLKLMNKQRSDILSAVSHEIKNPLASIIGYSELVLEDPNLKEALRQKFLKKILNNSRKITTMIDRLTLSVKLENNDLTLEKKRVELMHVTQDAIDTLKQKYPDRVIKLTAKKQYLNADETLIELVIINLIENALKYSSDTVNVTLNSKKLMVQDYGLGISKDDINKITSKFYRVDSNSWDNSMGLGLAIVTYILKQHDSELTISSTLGEGSTFEFNVS
jgi:signal transduction histidine kinase